MSFTSNQLRHLRARIRPQVVKQREVEGKVLHYLEGWHIISEANRIFGFDAWDRETLHSQCVWQKPVDYRFAAAYLTRVRITVRAGDKIIQREGLGSGEAVAATAGQAHERASKAAETDATKRALSTFGNPFGLSLYKDKAEPPKVKRSSNVAAAPSNLQGPVVSELAVSAAAAATPTDDEDEPAQKSGPALPDPAPATNVRALSALPGRMPMKEVSLPVRVPLTDRDAAHFPTHSAATAPELEPRLEEESASTRLSEEQPDPQRPAPTSSTPIIEQTWSEASAEIRPDIEASALLLPLPKRLRSREHLKFVASQPCLICARAPSQAHHLRFAQPRALGRKVSDEFTVPLCGNHHHELHMRGNERAWWEGKNIDPLPIAADLWSESLNQTNP